MYYVSILTLIPDGFFSSLRLTSALRGLAPSAQTRPGLRSVTHFRQGRHLFANLVWTEATSQEGFSAGPTMRELRSLAKENAAYFTEETFLCEKPPSQAETVDLWRKSHPPTAA